MLFNDILQEILTACCAGPCIDKTRFNVYMMNFESKEWHLRQRMSRYNDQSLHRTQVSAKLSLFTSNEHFFSIFLKWSQGLDAIYINLWLQLLGQPNVFAQSMWCSLSF